MRFVEEADSFITENILEEFWVDVLSNIFLIQWIAKKRLAPRITHMTDPFGIIDHATFCPIGIAS